MKINCITAAALSALLIAISVFIGNVSHTEYKSQMRKRKIRKSTLPLSTNAIVEDKTIDAASLTDLTTTPANV